MSSISSTASRRTTRSVDVSLVRPGGCGYTPALPRRLVKAAARINAAPGVRPKRTMRDHLHENATWNGAIAQLGERFNGIEEVVGSIPSGSTIAENTIS